MPRAARTNPSSATSRRSLPIASDAPLFGGEPAPIPTRFVRVAVERSIEHTGDLDEGLTYSVPDALPSPAPGQRVIVPLGRGRPVRGIVLAAGGIELLAGLHPSRVKAIRTLEDDAASPALSRALMELANWISSYYVCPLGMTLAAMVPAAVKLGVGARTRAWVSLGPRPQATGPATEPVATPKPTRTSAKAWKAVQAIPDSAWPMPLDALASLVDVKSPRPIQRLAELGLLAIERREEVAADDIPDALYPDQERGPVAPPTPTHDQARAIQAISPTLASFRVHLLRGVTGSGKTEVYLRLIERVLALPRGAALVLVPEIALTPQTCRRFIDRFGPAQVAVLHSGLTAAQRHREWARVRDGSARVAVGARSAVFAPLGGLSLVVVDEEHDASYKQDQLPRYHARDVAIKRAQIEGACVVLGSATPSLESWANCRPGPSDAPPRFTLHELPTRAGSARLPDVRLVDMREERRLRERQPTHDPRRWKLLGPTLEGELARTLDLGQQAMLLLNRRGLGRRLACVSVACGFIAQCEDCSAALVMHRERGLPSGGFVRCHHCLREQRVPSLCPACGRAVRAQGFGTQRLEEELERSFASLGLRQGSTLLRLDSDAMRTSRDLAQALARFASGEVRVLVGTQMIAKGLDFPGVTLVGVVDGDTALALPDFRASERTFQLVSQAAGRAGRAGLPGRVIVQTHCPGEASLVAAARHDYVAFAEGELAARERFALPPASRLARVVCRDPDRGACEARCEALARALLDAAGERARVDGPTPCALERVATQWRFAVDVYAPDARTLRDVLTRVRARGMLTSDAHTSVDVDPVAML
jgi:primosomal protein N' (replication factor Y)